MRASAAPLKSRRPALVAFLVAELVLVLAIPFLMIHGYYTLLESRAGSLIAETGPNDPGWLALVDPSQVVGVAEVAQGTVTGITLVIHNPLDGSTGGAILIPGTLELDGSTLSQREPAEAVLAVSAALRLGVSRVEVLDESGWAELLGSTTYVVDNPDPVSGLDAGPSFAVGPTEVRSDLAAAFVGSPADGAGPVSVLPRRRLLWQALLANPPSTDSELAADLAAIDSATSQVFDIPVISLEPVATLDLATAESLLREVVAFPAGAVVGDRVGVRVVDRIGNTDLASAAATVAATGFEVVSIANADRFEQGPTQLLVPAGLLNDPVAVADLENLEAVLGLEAIPVDEAATPTGVDEDRPLVTVVVGSDQSWIESS